MQRNCIAARELCDLLSGGQRKKFLDMAGFLLRGAIERKLNRLFSHANAMLPADFVCVTYEMKVPWPGTAFLESARSFPIRCFTIPASSVGQPRPLMAPLPFHLNGPLDGGGSTVAGIATRS